MIKRDHAASLANAARLPSIDATEVTLDEISADALREYIPMLAEIAPKELMLDGVEIDGDNIVRLVQTGALARCERLRFVISACGAAGSETLVKRLTSDNLPSLTVRTHPSDWDDERLRSNA